MVRVAGRSGSCHTCIQRHVKCDQGKPGCERCVKAGYTCRGYTRELQIVDEGRKLEQRLLVRSAAAASSSSAAAAAAAPAAAAAAAARGEPSHAEKALCVPWRQNTNIPAALNCSAFQAEMHICFFDKNMFMRGGFLKFWNWIDVDDGSSLTFQHCLEALHAIYFGRKFNCQQSKMLGLARYGQGLSRLNKDLQDKRQALELSTLASILTLQTVEIVGQTSLPAWLHHSRALSKIVQLRGPKAFQSVGERRMLEMIRGAIILQSLHDREPCFLAQQEWKTTPWLNSPKTIAYQLHDIFCDIPGVVADAFQFQTQALTPKLKNKLYVRISSKIHTLFYNCFEWRAKWEREYPDCCSEVPVMDHSRVKAPFTTRLQFSRMLLVYCIILYNAILTILFRLADFILGRNFDVLEIARQILYWKTNRILKAPEEVLNIRVAAMEILRCVQAHLQDQSNTTGAYLVSFPLGCAYETYTEETTEAIWIKFMMQELERTSGFELSRGWDWVKRSSDYV